MKNKILLITFIVASFFNTNFIAHSEESIEEIIKGRKAIFSNNAKLAKRVNILLKDFEVEEAEPIILEMSKNYENLLNYSIGFSPSNNLIISGNFINKSLNESLSDNYFFNNFGIFSH